MDKQQEESRRMFEKEMASRGWSTQATSTGDYVHERVALMWVAWKASRASIVVELPDWHDPYENWMEETRNAIRSIGLSIKGE